MAESKTTLWIYLGLGLAAGIGVAQILRGPKIVPGKSRVLLVGDSLAVGLGPYLKQLASERKVAFDTIAIVGTRLDQWAKNPALVAKLEEFNPTLVLVSLGTNDEYMQGNVVAKQKLALEQLLAEINGYRHNHDYGLGPEAIVWIGPPTLPKPRSNGIVPMLKAEVPHYYPSESLTIPRGPDGLHPTARGYAGWAGAIWQWLS